MLFWFGLAVVSVSCAELKAEELGSRIRAPFDIVLVAKWNDYVVLNSSFDVRFETGSLQRLGLKSDGTVEKKQTVKVPRLGSRLALTDDGSKLAAAFSGPAGGIRIFDLSDDGIAEAPAVFVPLSDDLVITDIDWIRTGSGAAARDLLAVEQGGNNRAGRVRLYELSDSSLKPLFTIPDDLPLARNPVYELGHSSVVHIPGSNLLAFFPSDGIGRFGDRPSPYEVVKSGAWSSQSDVRAVSMVVVDLDTYLESQNLEQSAGYVPLALNDNLGTANAAAPASDGANASLKFRTQFSEATFAKSEGCGVVAGAKADDLVLAALYGSGHVIGISGWGTLKAALAQRAGKTAPADKLFPSTLAVAPYSLGDGAGSHPKGIFRVTQLRSERLGDEAQTCVPLIVRADVKISEGLLTNAGRESVWVSHSLGREPSQPAVYALPERASLRFAGDKGGLFFVSFSRDAIVPALLAAEGAISFGPVFREPD